MPKIDIVFIVGIGRSGTSLLQNMLNSSSRVDFLPENSFLRRYVASGEFERLVTAYDAEKVADILLADESFRRIALEKDKLSEMISGCGEHSGIEFFTMVMREFCVDSSRLRFVGDKDPRLIEYLPLLHGGFPGARLIHIYRDPRDVALSKTKAAWSKGRPFFANLFAGRVQWALVREYGEKLFGEKFFELAYEDLTSSPESTIREICDFLDIEFELSMMLPSEGGAVLVAKDEMSWKKESLGPVLSNNSEKWRKGLSSSQIALSETIATKMMLQAGYTESGAKNCLNFFQKATILFQLFAVVILDPIYCRFRIWQQLKSKA